MMQPNKSTNHSVSLTNVEVKQLVKYIESFENMVGNINQDLYIKLVRLIKK